MSFDYSKLLGRIKEVCGTQEQFANLLGMGRVSLSHRLNNKLDFDVPEIRKACEVLEIPEADIPSYFFCIASSETRTEGGLL